MPEPLLKVENLKVSFKIKKQKTAAVEDVNFSLDEGKIIGIVGESGCGKSVTATSILRLMPPSLVKSTRTARSCSKARIFPRPPTRRCGTCAATRSR